MLGVLAQATCPVVHLWSAAWREHLFRMGVVAAKRGPVPAQL